MEYTLSYPVHEMSDANKAALPSCSSDQYIWCMHRTAWSHEHNHIFPLAYFHPHLLLQLCYKHCIRKHVVKKWKNENWNLQTAGRFTAAVKKNSLDSLDEDLREAGWTSMAESADDLPSSAILERKNVCMLFKRSFPEFLLKVPVWKHGPVLSGRPLPSPLVSDWWRPLLPGPVSQWIKPDQCDSDGVLWAQ